MSKYYSYFLFITNIIDDTISADPKISKRLGIWLKVNIAIIDATTGSNKPIVSIYCGLTLFDA